MGSWAAITTSFQRYYIITDAAVEGRDKFLVNQAPRYSPARRRPPSALS